MKRARELANQLRALDAPTQYLCSIPSNYGDSQPLAIPVPENLMVSSSLSIYQVQI